MKSAPAAMQYEFICPRLLISNMLKIGHRGARVYEPENTLSSYKKALELAEEFLRTVCHHLLGGTDIYFCSVILPSL